MIARILFALGLLLPALTRAEYDWYTQKEGSSSRREAEPESESDDDDDGGYDDESGSSSRASGEGFVIGLRFAYAHPIGEAAKGADIDDITSGVLKGQLDLDYGIDPHFVVGVYLAAGGGLLSKPLKRACEPTVAGIRFEADCKVVSIEAGLAAAYRLFPERLINPWLGANVGLEWLQFSLEERGVEGKLANLGLAFGLSVGADVQLGSFAFGPYFSPQFSRFMRAKSKLSAPIGLGEDEGEQSGKIDRQTFHYWLNFGLRARYQF